MDKYNASIFPSAVRTATSNVEIEDRHAEGIHVIINVTLDAALASVVPTIDGFDPLSETWYNILTASAVTAVGTTVLRVHPDLVAVANLTANDFLPRKYRVVMTHADADAITYSIGINSVK